MGKIEKIHNMLVTGEISCRELTKEYLDCIRRDDGTLSSFITVTKESALESARKVDEKLARGESIGMLSGVPMCLKDNISTKGIRTTCASKMLLDYTPVYDATAYSRLKSQGAVLLGKNNMDEFAMGNTGENSCLAPCKNPFDFSRVAGGSSSGSACAVSSNLAVYSLGSDTGGSVRQPAAYCGLVGLKPTFGAVSRYGLIAYSSSLEQIGPMGTSVEDVSLVFDVICGKDVLDSTCNREYKESTFVHLNDSIKGRKVGIIREFSEGEHICSEVKKAVKKTVKTFESMGAQVVVLDMPELLQAVPVYYIIACAEASSNLARYDGIRYGYRAQGDFKSVHELICRSRSEAFGKEVKRRILMGTNVLSGDKCSFYYDKANLLKENICRQFARAFEKCDVIITPTTPTPAFECNRKAESVELLAEDVCTVPVNLASLPAVSLPCAVSDKGLPIGVQIIGNKFCEALVLNMAYKYQEEAQLTFNTKWGVSL